MALLTLFSGSLKAYDIQETDSTLLQKIDSTVSLSLLTCQPGQEAYSLYGHTAIHYVDTEKNIDIAVNYGMFNFRKPHFVLRFIFGLTDYEMGIQPYDYFCGAYGFDRRGIVEQELNLTAEDKLVICRAIEENYLPENREYRYNIFYDNCTTRARDMLLLPFAESTDGNRKVEIERKDNGPSFRELTHQYTQGRPWAQLGNDLLLGLKADWPTTVSEQQFLPYNLMDDFDNATIVFQDSLVDGKPVTQKLLKEKRVLVEMFDNPVEKEFPLSPTACALILALIIVAVTVWEYRQKKMLWGFDLVLLLLIGICGLVLTAMIFSQHPTVNINLQIFLLNPLALILLWSTVRREAKGQSHWFWKVYAACLIVFFIGNFLQYYAEGTNILASSLLIRCCERIFTKPVKRQ
ncbi:MAG: DUF4105 domain-containing protein [Prevotella sp.]|nr:DUF4105 domain-containing protein [Prevotella sp.]